MAVEGGVTLFREARPWQGVQWRVGLVHRVARGMGVRQLQRGYGGQDRLRHGIGSGQGGGGGTTPGQALKSMPFVGPLAEPVRRTVVVLMLVGIVVSRPARESLRGCRHLVEHRTFFAERWGIGERGRIDAVPRPTLLGGWRVPVRVVCRRQWRQAFAVVLTGEVTGMGAVEVRGGWGVRAGALHLPELWSAAGRAAAAFKTPALERPLNEGPVAGRVPGMARREVAGGAARLGGDMAWARALETTVGLKMRAFLDVWGVVGAVMMELRVF